MKCGRSNLTGNNPGFSCGNFYVHIPKEYAKTASAYDVNKMKKVFEYLYDKFMEDYDLRYLESGNDNDIHYYDWNAFQLEGKIKPHIDTLATIVVKNKKYKYVDDKTYYIYRYLDKSYGYRRRDENGFYYDSDGYPFNNDDFTYKVMNANEE